MHMGRTNWTLSYKRGGSDEGLEGREVGVGMDMDLIYWYQI